MFDLCYECGDKLVEQTGTIYGYWGQTKIEFIKLPMYKCSNCEEFYVGQEMAILSQEITRALNDINKVPKVVDISNSYKTLVKHLEEIHEMIVDDKIPLVEVNCKAIINNKDVISSFNEDSVMIAARNVDDITEDVKDEISKIMEENDRYKP